jgi:hypothetical protein
MIAFGLAESVTEGRSVVSDQQLRNLPLPVFADAVGDLDLLDVES